MNMSEDSQAISNMLNVLGYSRLWLDAGVLSEEVLCLQFAAYEKGEESDTAHFRHRTFIEFLAARQSIDDLTLERIRGLDDDSQLNSPLSHSRIIEVIRRHLLTEDQLNVLRADISVFAIPVLKRAIERELVRLAILANSMSRARDFFMHSKDPEVQRAVVESAQCPTNDLQWLAAHGLTKTVRNLALDRLRRHLKNS